MAEIAVVVPVLARPENVSPLIDSLCASTFRARLLFVISPDDDTEKTAVLRAMSDNQRVDALFADWPPGPGDYARKINLAYTATDEPLILLGADDLRFHPGWLEAVEETASRFDAGVIGTNDMANPEVKAGRHATHPVVRRCYIDTHGGVVGEPGKVYCEQYDHNYVDNELVATAQARGCFVACPEARVEHLHWLWKTAVKDATYVKGGAHARNDGRLFESRRHLWEHEAALT